MSSAATRPISGGAQATTPDRWGGWRAQRGHATKTSSPACRVRGVDRRRRRPPPRTAVAGQISMVLANGPAPGGRRPNDAVQLRASSPVCCNIWLGAPASLRHPDVSASAKRIRHLNGAVRRERAASRVDGGAGGGGQRPRANGRGAREARRRGDRAAGAGRRARSPRRESTARVSSRPEG